jgi:hypothetical protein
MTGMMQCDPVKRSVKEWGSEKPGSAHSVPMRSLPVRTGLLPAMLLAPLLQNIIKSLCKQEQD